MRKSTLCLYELQRHRSFRAAMQFDHGLYCWASLDFIIHVPPVSKLQGPIWRLTIAEQVDLCHTLAQGCGNNTKIYLSRDKLMKEIHLS